MTRRAQRRVIEVIIVEVRVPCVSCVRVDRMISKATCVGNILSIIYHLLSHLPAGKHTQTDILISYIYIYIQTDILIYMCIYMFVAFGGFALWLFVARGSFSFFS